MQKLLFVCFLLPALLRGQGMWLPLNLEKQNEKDMQAMGLKLDADDIYSPLEPSLKDAVCQFSGGCTGDLSGRLAVDQPPLRFRRHPNAVYAGK